MSRCRRTGSRNDPAQSSARAARAGTVAACVPHCGPERRRTPRRLDPTPGCPRARRRPRAPSRRLRRPPIADRYCSAASSDNRSRSNDSLGGRPPTRSASGIRPGTGPSDDPAPPPATARRLDTLVRGESRGTRFSQVGPGRHKRPKRLSELAWIENYRFVASSNGAATLSFALRARQAPAVGLKPCGSNGARKIRVCLL